VTLADGIQLVIALATLAAAAAAGIAARASQASAKQMRVAQQVEWHRARMAMLQELLGVVAELAAGVHPMQLGTGYTRGARIRGLVVALGGDLPHCTKLGQAMQKLNAPAELITAAEAELRLAIAVERVRIVTPELKPAVAVERVLFAKPELKPAHLTAGIMARKWLSMRRSRAR
jgi:hypothetical protein